MRALIRPCRYEDVTAEIFYCTAQQDHWRAKTAAQLIAQGKNVAYAYRVIEFPESTHYRWKQSLVIDSAQTKGVLG